MTVRLKLMGIRVVEVVTDLIERPVVVVVDLSQEDHRGSLSASISRY
jgi:hypothetical protein